MVADRIEREVLIDAPVEVVWSIVTEPEHVGSWFSDAATLDLRPGGQALLTWDQYGSYRARVVAVDPPHRFSFRWTRRVGEEPVERQSTLVEFLLSPEDGGTRLRVVERGFASLEWSEEDRAAYYGENSQGWDLELEELRSYVATRVGGRDVRPR